MSSQAADRPPMTEEDYAKYTELVRARVQAGIDEVAESDHNREVCGIYLEADNYYGSLWVAINTMKAVREELKRQDVDPYEAWTALGPGDWPLTDLGKDTKELWALEGKYHDYMNSLSDDDEPDSPFNTEIKKFEAAVTQGLMSADLSKLDKTEGFVIWTASHDESEEVDLANMRKTNDPAVVDRIIEWVKRVRKDEDLV